MWCTAVNRAVERSNRSGPTSTMAAIYETDDGTQFDTDNVKRKEKCDFCGKLGDIDDGEDNFNQGELPSLHGEGINGDYANICRECLKNGVSEEDINEAIGDPEELQEAEVEL